MTPAAEPWGIRLRRLREAAGVTREALAEQAGLSANAIAALERGERKHPYPHTVTALADALGLTGVDRDTFRQAVPSRVAVPASVGQQLLPPLPIPPTRLVGREGDVAAVMTLLDRGGRVVTLTGPGGVGKTRLALTIAELATPRFADGVVFVALAALTDSALVLSTIARVLGSGEADAQSLQMSLHTFLHHKQMLLVLDNFEQVLDDAPEVAALLSATSGVVVLATSRAPLRIRGEREYAVAPLPVPELARVPSEEEIATVPAVALFVERAQDVAPSFVLGRSNAAAVAAICRRLDGLPLALELAAARTKLLPPMTLLARLDRALPLLTGGARDLPARHQTLRDTLAWSYQLLAASEQALLARLAIFVDGCTLEAAEAVCQVADSEEIFSDFQALVDNSLLTQRLDLAGEPRFGMLELVREYALEHLEGRGELATLQQRHATYFLQLAEQARANFFGDDLVRWLDRSDAEIDNIRAVLRWSLTTHGDAMLGLQLAGFLWRFWELRGYLAEGRRWLKELLARSPAHPTLARMNALHTAGNLAFAQGDYEQAHAAYQACLEDAKALDQQKMIGHMHNNLGNVAANYGEYDQAVLLFADALTIYQAMGDSWTTALALGNLGDVEHRRSNYERARPHYEQSLALYRSLGDTAAIALKLYDLGRLARDQLDFGHAAVLFAQALQLYKQVGNKRGIASVVDMQGELAQSRGDGARAMVLHQEALAAFGELGDESGMVRALHNLGLVAQQQGDIGAALWFHQECLELFRKLRDKAGIGMTLREIATVALAGGNVTVAAQLSAGLEAVHSGSNQVPSPGERATHEPSWEQLIATALALKL